MLAPALLLALAVPSSPARQEPGSPPGRLRPADTLAVDGLPPRFVLELRWRQPDASVSGLLEVPGAGAIGLDGFGVGDWHRLRLRAAADASGVWVDGVLRLRVPPRPPTAPSCLVLRARGGDLEYQGLTIRALPADARLLDPPPPETPAETAARCAWWEEARFGIFIHWGLYAIPGGVWKGQRIPGIGEWIMHTARIPPAEYEPLRARWNPARFDARAWARLFRDAGAGYVVITTKHHDGFCLYDAPGTDWDVMSTPWKHDVMAELAEAVRAEGMRIGWYHSILDWHHADYLPRRPWDPRPAEDADFGRYVAFLKQQVQHLLTHYGPIGVMWFDGEWEDTWTHELGRDLYGFVRALQPDILVNNRVDKGRQGMAGLTREGDYAGDFGTPEQEVPATGIPGVRWESCMTMNDTWGWKSWDHNWKSAAQLIRILCDTASKGGNFLLNVGPTPEGEIPPESVERLRAIGRWLARNGEAIRGTRAGPFRRLPWGRATRKGDRLYLLVFDWPKDGRLPVPGLRTAIRRAWLLARPETGDLAVAGSTDGPVLQVPAAAPDAPVAVVVLDLAGPPEVVPVLPKPDAAGRLRLEAADADIHGRSARYEAGPDHRNIGYWTDQEDTVSWTFELPEGGRWRLAAEIAAIPESAGGRFRVRVGERRLPGIVPDTGSWTRFTTLELGVLELPAGRHELVVEPVELAGQALMNLRAVALERRP